MMEDGMAVKTKGVHEVPGKGVGARERGGALKAAFAGRQKEAFVTHERELFQGAVIKREK